MTSKKTGRGTKGRTESVQDPSSPLEACPPSTEAAAPLDAIALYDVDRVCAALGASGDHDAAFELPRDTEHQCRLASIAERGEEGRWRRLVPPPDGVEEAVRRLAARAPHLAELTELVVTRLRAARTIGLPTALPPVILVGGPGIGKTWFLSRLSAILGLPFRRYPMSASTLAEGIQGSHPSWRNAQPGLVASTLLAGRVANPILFVDEFDKVCSHGYNSDPFRAFYSLLDSSDSRAFVDEYLGFPIDASRVLWTMAANEVDGIPAPILDRLRVIHVPEVDVAQRLTVALSIYIDANRAHRDFFEAFASPAVLERLALLSPRGMRKALDEAMAHAAADGRRELAADDLFDEAAATMRKRFGFCG